MRTHRPLLAALAVAVATSLSAAPALAAPGHAHKRVCGPANVHFASCHAEVVTNADLTPLATTSYQSGYAPADLISAYKLPAAPASGTPTVAIVDAYDAPNLEADLGVYRAQFGLPACTTANGCFKKVNQNGVQGSYPAADVGWAQETSLDVDMVSAICPACKILVVEASSSSLGNLGTAVNTAASTPGVIAVSNSYGGNDGSYAPSYETTYYKHPGIDITVSSGDSGYGGNNGSTVEFPASSQYVTAVGGTKLVRNSGVSRGWSESAWTGAGSGCSAYVTKPAWQTDPSCAKRMVADVSAVADPATGVAVYDSYGSSNGANWFVFGGTSVASPIVAAVDALAGGRAGTAAAPTYGQYAYTHGADFFDVSGGTNSTSGCTFAYFCTGLAGYDGPTGVGSPNGAANGGTTPPPPPAPTFTLTASPSSRSIVRGGSTTYTGTVTPANGYSASTTVSISGAPQGVTVTGSPATLASGTGAATFGVAASSTARVGSYTLTITASGGGITKTATVTLQIKRK